MISAPMKVYYQQNPISQFLFTFLAIFLIAALEFEQMIFPWMFDDMAALRPFKEAANIIAETTDWPPLYNKKQLNDNKVREQNPRTTLTFKKVI